MGGLRFKGWFKQRFSLFTTFGARSFGALLSLVLAGTQFKLIGFSWMLASLLGGLMFILLAKTVYLLPLFWLAGTLLDLLGGTTLGLGGMWLLAQMMGLELKFTARIPLTWLVATSFIWLIINY